MKDKCFVLECEYCVKGKKKTICVICGNWNHQFGTNSYTNKPRKDLEFLDVTYSYEGYAYDILPLGVNYGICRMNYCLFLFSIYQKISFVFQCIKEDKNVEHFPSDKEIERKVAFYYAEVRHQTGGSWKCDIVNCPGCLKKGSDNCWEKSLRYFTEELMRTEESINNFKTLNYPFCYCCRTDNWWNSFIELYDRIMTFEPRRDKLSTTWTTPT